MESRDDETIRLATRVYTTTGLAIYDSVIMGLFAHVIWRCHPDRFVEVYRQNLSGNHADIGVGTGYCLDRSGFRSSNPRLALIDIKENCLRHSARRLSRYSPRTYLRNACEAMVIEGEPFDSVGLGGLLHCLPGSMRDKGRVFDAIRPLIHGRSVVFGYSLVRDNVATSFRSWAAHRALNGLRIINNRADWAADLREELSRRFRQISVEICGPIAFFRATDLATQQPQNP